MSTVKIVLLVLFALGAISFILSAFVKSDANNGGFILQGLLWIVGAGCWIALACLAAFELFRIIP